MNYLSISKEGHLLSEKTQLGYFKEAARAYGNALEEINAELKGLYAAIPSVQGDDIYNAAIKYDRLNKLKTKITAIYKKYSLIAGEGIKKGLIEGAVENYNRNAYLASWVESIKIVPIDQRLVEYMTTGNVEAWKDIQKTALSKIYAPFSLYAPQAGTLTDLLAKNYSVELSQVLTIIESGLIRGDSYKNTSKKIKTIIGNAIIKDNEIKGNGAAYNAMRIARTEGNRVLNASGLAQMKQVESQGISTEKMWIASLDGRTRESHGALDGKTAPIGKEFPGGVMAPGQWGDPAEDINCRCSMIQIVGGKSPQIRASVNPETGDYEAISWKSYDDWKKSHEL